MIVYFYPAAMTPGCTKQACDFSDNIASLRGAGYEVLGISPDKPEKLAKFREKESLGITLLSDADKSVMADWATYGEKQLYGKTVQGVIRSTFVVDEQGKVERRAVQRQGHRSRRQAAQGPGPSELGDRQRASEAAVVEEAR